jgi:hypothetical protein
LIGEWLVIDNKATYLYSLSYTLKNRSCIYQTAVNFSFYKHIAAVEQIAAILFMRVAAVRA